MLVATLDAHAAFDAILPEKVGEQLHERGAANGRLGMHMDGPESIRRFLRVCPKNPHMRHRSFDCGNLGMKLCTTARRCCRASSGLSTNDSSMGHRRGYTRRSLSDGTKGTTERQTKVSGQSERSRRLWKQQDSPGHRSVPTFAATSDHTRSATSRLLREVPSTRAMIADGTRKAGRTLGDASEPTRGRVSEMQARVQHGGRAGPQPPIREAEPPGPDGPTRIGPMSDGTRRPDSWASADVGLLPTPRTNSKHTASCF